MKRYQIIANPSARKGTAARRIPLIEAELKRLNIAYDLEYTRAPWHAAQIAYRAAQDGYYGVVSAGGDGTCNETLNGLMRARDEGREIPSLGMLCIGTGNDYAYGAGMPLDWKEGCRALQEGKTRRIDVCRATGECMDRERYLGNGAGIGFDAVGAKLASRSKLRGFLSYLVAALRTITLYYHAPITKIECDDKTITQPSIMISVMNGRRMAGGFMMTPESSISDGMLDLCIAHEVSRLTILMLIPRFLNGTQKGHPAIRFERTRKVKITGMDGALPNQGDGEEICPTCHWLQFETIPSAIEVITL